MKRPIHVYGHGIDPEIFYPLERPIRETYTFLHYGRLSARKGTDLVYKAFVEEFSHGEDVRLILKDTVPICPVVINDSRVEWIHATYSKEQMRELMRAADCFVFPTRGEGFGLPPLEAMATGLPTIVTNWSGPVDFADPADTLLLPYKMERSHEFDAIYQDFLSPGETSGEWAEPDFGELKRLMRWCFEHRGESRMMGMQSAERLSRDWTWQKKVKELLGIIEASL